MKKTFAPVVAVVLLFAAVAMAAALGPRVSGDPIAVTITVYAAKPAGELDHAWEAMTGSGNASLYIREGGWGDRITAHLADVHDRLGIRMVRFHGIFLDSIGIYQGPGRYDFTNADRIYDRILATGVKPFVELSFMPEALASGKAVGFPRGYRPNITPPKDYDEWARMNAALVRHLIERYGIDEVKTWYFEVWNEPDLAGVFWTGTQEEYFRLYDVTAKAIKAVSPEVRVGGPSTSQSAWLDAFSRHCRETGVPLDFMSSHGYYNDPLTRLLDQVRAVFPGEAPDLSAGKFHYALSTDNRIIEKLYGRPMPFFFTEWGSSSSYSYALTGMWGGANDHDMPNDAPFMAKAVLEANGLTAGFSHWCHSDVFEEWGLPGTKWPVKKAAFHGGFGLITVDGIHKPAYHAFAFLHRMGKKLVATEVRSPRSEVNALATLDDGRLAVIAWHYLNTVDAREKSAPSARVTLKLENLPPELVGKKLTAYRIDWTHGNAYAAWVRMGSPGNLTAEQAGKLKSVSDDTLRAPELDRTLAPGLTLDFPLDPEGQVFFVSE